MSVINKMLRDLDARQSQQLQAQAARRSGTGVAAGTTVVGGPAAAASSGGRFQVWQRLTALLLLVVVAAGAWLAGFGRVAPGPLSNAKLPALAASASVLVASNDLPVAITQSATEAINNVAIKMSKEAQVPVKVPVQAAALEPPEQAKPIKPAVPDPARLVTSGALAATGNPPAATTLAQRNVAAASAPLVKPATARPTSSPAVASTQPVAVSSSAPARASTALAAASARSESGNTEHQLVRQILAQAQAQWNQSDHAGALSLLQSAMAQLEQSGTADSADLLALVREHTRMAIGQGQAEQGLSWLIRLEPRLASSADAWALRGSLGQRLGLHPAAAQAYLRALALRPTEPRWMQAAAVSLAAQGQLDAAAQWAEKARLSGGMRPDVANYLRQLGVAVRTD